MEGGGPAPRHDESTRRICITGMHRTGTSLVAALLQRHGLWLGDEADIMPANPYNPDGYFENLRVVEIDDEILSRFGGTWRSLPLLPPGWTEDGRLADLKARARALGEGLRPGHRIWGFKDPRAALTLPFWQAMWGALTVIVTVRNPLETARSLNRRDQMTLTQGMELWAAHYRSILEHTDPAARIVVGYEAFCSDPVSAAAALLSRLPELHEPDVDATRALVRAPLRHFRETLADLEALAAPAGVLELYSRLRSEAINPEPRVDSSDEPLSQLLRGLPAAISSLDLAIRDVHVDVQRLAAVVARLEDEVGFIRGSDLAGIAAQLEHERHHVERIAEELPPLNDRVSATEAALQISSNGRRE